ncbi:methyl-accepting chemotaxis protein [bacterium]|nr:methyl-accepting chemotaxis protein [bacterium]
MLKKLKFKHKIILLPLLAALAFTLILAFNLVIGQRNIKSLNDIENGFAPALNMSRDIEEMLDSFQRNMQDAVSAGDEDMLRDILAIRDSMVTRLADEKDNPALNVEDLSELSQSLTDYANLAYETSLQIIRGDMGEALTKSAERMRDEYIRLNDNLITETNNKQEAMKAAFASTRQSQKTSLNLVIVITIVCLCAMILLSAWIIRGIIRPFSESIRFAQTIGQGDLSTTLELNTYDETKELGDALNKMATSLRLIIGKIKQSDLDIQQAINELRSSIVEQTQSISNQATSVSEISTTINEIKTTSRQTASFAQRVLEDSDRSVAVTRDGMIMNEKSVKGMDQIREQMETIAQTILSFSERSQQIVDIIASVNDLAQQSTILALNASIEAAKAGEHGKGFAVVAMEVRNLAEQSQEATAQIRTILNEIQNAINSAVIVTENGTKKVSEGVVLIERMGEVITQLSNVVNESATSSKQISASTTQQSAGIDQMASAISEIDLAMNESTANAKMIEKTAENLALIGEELSASVNKYDLGAH